MNTIKIEEVAFDTRAVNMAIGEFAVVTSTGLAHNHIIVRAAGSNFYSLTEPGTFLSDYDMDSVRVRILEPGTKINITVGLRLSDSDKRIVAKFLHESRKIEAIKHVRTVTRAGLKDAKDWCDSFNFGEWLAEPKPFPPPVENELPREDNDDYRF